MSDTQVGGIVLSWWREWIADRQSGAARGFAARARRSSDVELLCEAASHQLAQALRLRPGNAPQLLRLVRVLAALRENHEQPLARRLGGSDPVLSPARFNRLMRSGGEELTTSLVRAVAMLPPVNKSCNIKMVSEDYSSGTIRFARAGPLNITAQRRLKP